MALRKTHDAVYAGEKYTDRDGNEKTRYVNVGALFARDDGSMTMKLEAIPVGFTGWINFYEPKDRDTGGGTPRQNAPRATQRPTPATQAPVYDEFVDTIPFLSSMGAW